MTPPPGPSRRHRLAGPWGYLVAVASLLAAGATGALVATAVRGGDRACDAGTVARQALPAVVTVQAAGAGAGGSGSGVIIRGDGHIVTNDHV
ncbi:MAG TPA: hypothetical protein VES42_14015, partial [Pilimelia sp.]|nr:hypothetical protein [Pilimelia sp.]